MVYTFKSTPNNYWGPSPATIAVATLNSPEFAGYTYARPSLGGADMIVMKGAQTWTHSASGNQASMGSLGFQAWGSWYYGPHLFSKPSSDTGAVYEFALFDFGPPVAPKPVDQMLAQLNARGQAGFCTFSWDESNTGAGTAYLKRRNVAPLSRCRFEVIAPLPGGLQPYLDQLNTQGAKGFEPAITMWGSSIWRKDESQQVTYDYVAVDQPASNEALLAQLNEQGARGAIEWSTFIKFSGTFFYRRATNCTQPWLCGPY